MLQKEQLLPLILTVIIFFVLTAILRIESAVLNAVTISDIQIQIRWTDVFVGLTIYLKTSIDFAIFMGNLMHTNQGWRNRIAIESGTALGNALGTMLILAVWTFFKEINWLLALMVIIASLVLLRLAEEGLHHAQEYRGSFSHTFLNIVKYTEWLLKKINHIFAPVFSKIMPNLSLGRTKAKSFSQLLLFSFSVPFILGLDDFAGYVPLFNIVNVFGFATGVMLGHTILNIFLFLNPDKSVKAVKNPLISFAGGIAFVALALWGIREALLLLTNH